MWIGTGLPTRGFWSKLLSNGIQYTLQWLFIASHFETGDILPQSKVWKDSLGLTFIIKIFHGKNNAIIWSLYFINIHKKNFHGTLENREKRKTTKWKNNTTSTSIWVEGGGEPQSDKFEVCSNWKQPNGISWCYFRLHITHKAAKSTPSLTSQSCGDL